MDRQRDRGQHPVQHQQPVGEVVGVEAVGVRGEGDPDEPHRDEQDGVAQEGLRGRVVGDQVRQPGDRDHEDEVEEQLQPRRVTLAPRLLDRAQSRRLHPRRAGHAASVLPMWEGRSWRWNP
jgi:hypothetical protein